MGRDQKRSRSTSRSSRSGSYSELDMRMRRLEDLIHSKLGGVKKSRNRRGHRRSQSVDTDNSVPELRRPRRRYGLSSSPDSSEQDQTLRRSTSAGRKRKRNSSSSSEQELSVEGNHQNHKKCRDNLPKTHPPPPPSGEALDQSEDLLILQTDKSLTNEILECLGEDPNEEPLNKLELHNAVLGRWSKILAEGLGKEDRLQLCKKFPPPKNLENLGAPDLNEEIIKILSQDCLKKDKYQAVGQTQLAAAITAVGSALNKSLTHEQSDTLKPIIQDLSDAGKLLVDLQHYLSISRRYGILPSLDSSLKQVVTSCKVDDKLFGRNFNEKIKSAREIEKNSKDLKAFTPRPVGRQRKEDYDIGRHLNWKGPPQTVKRYSRQQGQKPQSQRNRSYQRRNIQAYKQRH